MLKDKFKIKKNIMKLKIKDLRVGNYVTHPNSKKDRIKEILCRSLTNDYAVSFINSHYNYYLENKGEEVVKPIKLTIEWLKKFGFEIDQNTKKSVFQVYKKTFDEYATFILKYNNRIEMFFFETDSEEKGFVKQLHYVHQLQNLYSSLTDDELTLVSKLEKYH